MIKGVPYARTRYASRLYVFRQGGLVLTGFKQTCQYNQYAAGCSGYQDRYCQNYPPCNASYDRADSSLTSSGTCTPCTNCSKLAGGFSVKRACGVYTDTECGSTPCNLTNPCNNTPDAIRYCDFTLVDTPAYQGTTGSCGLCPPGYSSNGLVCIQCPTGETCDDVGIPRCRGQCQFNQLAHCYPLTGIRALLALLV